MTEQERLGLLVAYSTSNNRICPEPIRWNQLWHILGCPSQELGPPLVLSGWAFSSDRDKRARFKEHLEYALKAGMLEAAETFVRGLGPGEWHTGEESHLDWSYGQALIEDEARRQQATTEAANLLRSESAPKDLVAHGPNGFADMIFIYCLALGGQDRRSNAEELRQQVTRFASLDDDGDFSLLDGVNAHVAAELRQIQEVRRKECLLAEFLVCIEDSGKPFDRDAIEDFTADVFDALRKQ